MNFEDVKNHRDEVRGNILKSFEPDFEKARSGVYADTAENRRLNRVGQTYGNKKQEQPGANKQSKKRDNSGAESAKKTLNTLVGDENLAYLFGEWDRWDGESDEVSEEQSKAFEELSKHYSYRYGKSFDARETEADEYKAAKESKGYTVVDTSGGSDTYTFCLFKKKK